MITNALGPMRVLDALQDLVAPDGLIGAMTSGQGSIARRYAGCGASWLVMLSWAAG